MNPVGPHQTGILPRGGRTESSHYPELVPYGSAALCRQFPEGFLYLYCIGIVSPPVFLYPQETIVVSDEKESAVRTDSTYAVHQSSVILLECFRIELVSRYIRVIDTYAEDNQIRMYIFQLLFKSVAFQPRRDSGSIYSRLVISNSPGMLSLRNQSP